MVLYCNCDLLGKCCGIKKKQRRVVVVAVMSGGWEDVSLGMADVDDEPGMRM